MPKTHPAAIQTHARTILFIIFLLLFIIIGFFCFVFADDVVVASHKDVIIYDKWFNYVFFRINGLIINSLFLKKKKIY